MTNVSGAASCPDDWLTIRHGRAPTAADTPPPVSCRGVEAGPVTKLTLAYDGTDFAGWARQPGLRTRPGGARARDRADPRRAARARASPGAPIAACTPGGRSRATATRRSTRAASTRCCPTTSPCSRASRRRGLRRAPQRAQPHLLLPPARRAACARRSSAAARCGCRGGSTATRSTPAPRRSSAPTSSRPSRRPRPTTCASSATCSRRAGSGEATLLEFWIEADSFMRQMNRALVGTMLEVARGRRSARGLRGAARGTPARRRRADAAAARPLPRPASPTPDAGANRRPNILDRVRNVLLTNDDGIEAEGLQTLRRALRGARRRAPRRDRARRQPLGDGALDHDAAAAVGHRGRRSATAAIGYATDGTPVDCVRLANLGLIEGFEADLVVSGINHGANLGDDITYSGTVAAALEGVVLGIPAIAVSQQSRAGELDWTADGTLRLRARGVVRRAPGRRCSSARRCRRRRCSTSTCPGGTPAGVEVTHARQARLPRRAAPRQRGGGPAALLGLRDRARLRGRARAPTSTRSRAGGSR